MVIHLELLTAPPQYYSPSLVPLDLQTQQGLGELYNTSNRCFTLTQGHCLIICFTTNTRVQEVNTLNHFALITSSTH